MKPEHKETAQQVWHLKHLIKIPLLHFLCQNNLYRLSAADMYIQYFNILNIFTGNGKFRHFAAAIRQLLSTRDPEI